MPVKMQPVSVIKANLGIEPNGRVHKFFTNECAKEMDRFVPFDNGDLAETVIQGGQPTRNVTANTITYEQEYAKVVYYGIRNGKQINIHTDKHADATTYWDKRMWTAKGQDIVNRVQDYVNRGGK
ncbi:MAG: hypothetical protein J6T23_02385 [Elusimicrobia bacterium]|nr:hypothetical protein [Elusimicrobiota bacterium]